MLSKCANPDCSTPFLYLREGKLFRMEIPVDGTSENGQTTSVATNAAVRYRVEFFWLCDYCSNRMTVAWKHGQGVRAVPLRQYKAAS
jgi:hypothetical protein